MIPLTLHLILLQFNVLALSASTDFQCQLAEQAHIALINNNVQELQLVIELYDLDNQEE